MWIKTQNGCLLNSAWVAKFEKDLTGIPKEGKYNVLALREDGTCLAILAKEVNAQKAEVVLMALEIAFKEGGRFLDIQQLSNRLDWVKGFQSLSS